MPKGKKNKNSNAQLLDALGMLFGVLQSSRGSGNPNYYVDPRLRRDPYIGYENVRGEWSDYPTPDDVGRETAESRLRRLMKGGL